MSILEILAVLLAGWKVRDLVKDIADEDFAGVGDNLSCSMTTPRRELTSYSQKQQPTSDHPELNPYWAGSS